MSDSSIFKVGKKMASISLDEPLNRIFQGFSEGGSEMSIGQFVQFAAEKKLIDKLLKATKCSIIFTKVKNRDKKKSTIDFEGFKVALQMMANIKGETYDHLVELCTGGMGAAADEGDANVDLPIEDRLSTAGGSSLTVEDFDLLKVLGKGSFGKVMLVRKKGIEGIDGLFAMKTLRKAQLIKRKQLQHTHTERRIAQEFQHPFLVNLRFAFQSPDKLYLVLDYMGGGELFFWLRQHRRFSKGRVRLYVAQMSLALECLHKSDIVYRDLKPENVLLDAMGNLRLTDFGLAKENVWGSGARGGTKTFCGTPEYLAPEVLENKGHGKGVDWWAMGTLAYEMLYGLPPFYDQNMQRMYQNILQMPLEWRGPLQSDEHADTRSFLEAILTRKVEDRLGCGKEGAKEIMGHPFNDCLDWDLVNNKQYRPEFVPPDDGEYGTTNFDEEFTREMPEDSVVAQHMNEADLEKTKFENFTFTSDGGALSS